METRFEEAQGFQSQAAAKPRGRGPARTPRPALPPLSDGRAEPRAHGDDALRAGLRCQEALNLRPRDVDLREYLIRVVSGKGDVDRTVPIEPALERDLIAWRTLRPAGPRFFCTLSGRPLDPRYVRRMVARYAGKARIDEAVHPHLLRHTAAPALDAALLPGILNQLARG